jgi:hypothetical protein
VISPTPFGTTTPTIPNCNPTPTPDFATPTPFETTTPYPTATLETTPAAPTNINITNFSGQSTQTAGWWLFLIGTIGFFIWHKQTANKN